MKKILLLILGLLFTCVGCVGHFHTFKGDASVSLFLHLPDAVDVQFASSIDKYQRHAARKNWWGAWQISVPLTPETRYFYIVDGAVYIPDCRFKESDDFGAESCIYLP